MFRALIEAIEGGISSELVLGTLTSPVANFLTFGPFRGKVDMGRLQLQTQFMDIHSTECKRAVHAELDSSGRIFLPSEPREQMHLAEGNIVTVVQENDGFKLQSFSDIVRRAQDYFCSIIPPGVSLVDELIAKRRAEAALEQRD